MKALIIDDEKKARILLETILKEHCSSFEMIFVASDLLSGVKIIKKEQPQVVFLDIEMPEHSGLEILDFFEPSSIKFEIIFTTAYSEYALQAFELSAIDYLLKPLRPAKVIAAVQKVLDTKQTLDRAKRLQELKRGFSQEHFTKIALPVSDGIKFVNFDDIIVLEADGMYTRITTTQESGIMISKPLKYFVNLLKNVVPFYRPHRSFLVNLKFIKQYVKSDGGYLLMENDKAVSISKDKREEFLQIVRSL